MTLFVLWGLALVATAYTLGRVHERHLADINADDRALDERLRRPLVTVTDGGWVDNILGDYQGDARHNWPQAAGSATQLATWAADSAVWPVIRTRYMTPERLAGIDA